jgi:hypothetical protein
MRNKLAIGMRDAQRAILWSSTGAGPGGPSEAVNKNAQKPAPARSQKLDLDNLDAFGIGHPLGNFGDLCDNFFFGNERHQTSIIKCNKKVGFRPLATFDNSIIHV